MKIALDAISPDPNQPRKIFNAAELQDLANSILATGLIQAITVRPRGDDTYWIVAGERRYRAHCLLREQGHKVASIDCEVKTQKSTYVTRVRQMAENMLRADMTIMEEARAIQNALTMKADGEEVTVAKLSKSLGKSVAFIESRLSLLNLSGEIQKMVEANQLSKPQALEIARLPDAADQTRIVQLLNKGELGKWKSLQNAVDALLNKASQVDMFGPSAPAASEADLETVTAMERKIERVAELLAAGWKDGECIVAARVSPDRAALMAQKLQACRVSIRHMEAELQAMQAQARIALAS